LRRREIDILACELDVPSSVRFGGAQLANRWWSAARWIRRAGHYVGDDWRVLTIA